MQWVPRREPKPTQIPWYNVSQEIINLSELPEIQINDDVKNSLNRTATGGSQQYSAPPFSTTLRFSSQGIAKLTEAIAKARAAFEIVRKSSDNPFYKDGQGKARKYADLTELINATAKPLADQGIHVFQAPTIGDQTVGLVTLISHSSGEWLEATMKGCPAIQKTDKGVRFDAQTIGIGITYLRRYSYGSLINLGAEDDDGNGLVEKQEKAKPEFASRIQQARTETKEAAKPASKESSSVLTVVTQSNADAEGFPLSDEDLKKTEAKGDPLPTKEQLKSYGETLRAYKQNSRALKSWVEKEANAEWPLITNFQFNNILAKLNRVDKEGGSPAIAKLIGVE